MSLRRIFGIVMMPAGILLVIASTCDTLLAIADYFVIPEVWGATCPSPFRAKALLIAGVVIAVAGQRLYSGRNLKTGEKVETENTGGSASRD